jgi:hypothetical protein
VRRCSTRDAFWAIPAAMGPGAPATSRGRHTSFCCPWLYRSSIKHSRIVQSALHRKRSFCDFTSSSPASDHSGNTCTAALPALPDEMPFREPLYLIRSVHRHDQGLHCPPVTHMLADAGAEAKGHTREVYARPWHTLVMNCSLAPEECQYRKSADTWMTS